MAMRISGAELDIMKVLWRSHSVEEGLAASDVHAQLANDKDWTSRTVKTLLSRLVEKGALTTQPDGRRYLYRVAISETDYKTSAAGRFVDQIFAGRAAPLVAHLADSRGLSEADIAELEKLLGELKK